MNYMIIIDGKIILFDDGQIILQVVIVVGLYILYLCYYLEFKLYGFCKLCIVKVNGWYVIFCMLWVVFGMWVESEMEEINVKCWVLIQMLFVEGNYFCFLCEKSGNCQLQVMVYYFGMMILYYDYFFLDCLFDVLYFEVIFEYNCCIFCLFCVWVSCDVDGKNVFVFFGCGIDMYFIVNVVLGQFGDIDFMMVDKVVEVCLVGVFLKKWQGFVVLIGQWKYDQKLILEQVDMVVEEY